jgi:hypothetical protein
VPLVTEVRDWIRRYPAVPVVAGLLILFLIVGAIVQKHSHHPRRSASGATPAGHSKAPVGSWADLLGCLQADRSLYVTAEPNFLGVETTGGSEFVAGITLMATTAAAAQAAVSQHQRSIANVEYYYGNAPPAATAAVSRCLSGVYR